MGLYSPPGCVGSQGAWGMFRFRGKVGRKPKLRAPSSLYGSDETIILLRLPSRQNLFTVEEGTP